MFYDVLVTAVYDESATYFDLLKGVLVLALIIFVSFKLLKHPLTWLVEGPMRNVMWKIVEVEFNRPDMIIWQEKFDVTDKEKFFHLFIVNYWPDEMLTNIQHLIGGLCAVPAALGVGNFSASERSSLACLGIMIEMGWEVQDFCKMFFYLTCMGEEGRQSYPGYLVFLVTTHHALTCTMGLPMIIAYRHSSLVHQLIFDLQFAGTFVGLFQQATRTLDVKKKTNLRIFVFISTLLLLTHLWTRFFHFFYLAYKIMEMFVVDKKWTFVVVGGIIFTIFSMFNVMFCVIPAYQRFVKFIKKLKEFESLPADADESKKRSVSTELELAAGELSSLETRLEDALLSIFADQKVERRHTFNSASLSQAAAIASEGVSRQSMVAWREMPSRVDARASKKTD